MREFLLFVHGAASSGRVWQSQLLDFPRSAAVDLPGHPFGRPVGDLPGYGAWLIEHVGAARYPAPLIGVGHSMGGAVLLQAVLKSPGLFGGLVLVATGARLPVNLRLLRGLEAEPEATLDRFLDLCFGPHAHPRTRAKFRQVARQLGPDLLRRDLEACSAFDVAARLGEVNLPTLVVCGDLDVMTPPSLSEELYRGIAGASLIVVPDTGHMVFLERRRLFRDSLQTFLAGLRYGG